MKGRKLIAGLARNGLARPLRHYYRHTHTTFAKQFLWKTLAAHLWWAESDVLASTFFGCSMNVNARDICGRFIYYFGIWEPNVTHWMLDRLKPGDMFIDIGANIGYYSLLASRLCSEVVALEAAPATYEMLRRNIDMNHIVNIRAHNLAAWNCDTNLEFFTSDMVTGTSTAVLKWAERCQLHSRCTVPAKPVFTVLSAEQISRMRIMKIDVEGAEWNVLQGIEPVLQHSRDDFEVMIEITTDFISWEEMTNLFAKYGFRPYLMTNDYRAAAYFEHCEYAPPRRITSLPNSEGQYDLVFSRA